MIMIFLLVVLGPELRGALARNYTSPFYIRRQGFTKLPLLVLNL